MPELTPSRDLTAYGAWMDAALPAKLGDILPHLAPGNVADRGCGTGALLHHLRSIGRDAVGIDTSPGLLKGQTGVVEADIRHRVLATESVDNVILSSAIHEVYSYAGASLEAVADCLKASAEELRPGGRIIIRDIYSPPSGGAPLTLRFDPFVMAQFTDFLGRQREVRDVLSVDRTTGNVVLPERTAVEFLSKKPYTQHWGLELNEVYTAVPFSVYKDIAAALGLRVIVAEATTNQWIVDNHWRPGVTGDLPQYTNQLVVLEK